LTGGAGYVGGSCLRWLLKHGHDAIAFDNLSEGHAKAVPEGRLVRGDLADVETLSRAMADHKVDAVMHFAAVASVPESIAQPEFYYRTNVIGTKNVLDSMVRANVRRIVFSSTAATYGFDNEMPLTEDSVQAPQVPYGTTKLAAEHMIRDYTRAYDLGFTIFRYFNASGADADGLHGENHRHETHLIPLILFAALGLREKVLIFGDDWDTRDGTCVRDFVHTDDLAQAHQLAVEDLQPGMTRVYNLGSGIGVTVGEVLTACEQVVGRPIPHERVARRPGDPAVLIASPDRAKCELGWCPKHEDIRQIAETAWRWHSTHTKGYAS
jgi:UDP-glucose 4-epimerase